MIGEHRIYVNLPDPKAHSNHLSEQVKLIMRLCMIGKLFLSNMCISIRKSYVAAFLKIHFYVKFGIILKDLGQEGLRIPKFSHGQSDV